MYIKFKSKETGSVLIAIIGVVSVLMIMAFSLSVKMRGAIEKAQTRVLVSDVDSIALSAQEYVINRLLKDGEAEKVIGANKVSTLHIQSLLEQDIEGKDYDNGSTASNLELKDEAGFGAPVIVQEFSAIKFAERDGVDDGHLPDGDLSLDPGRVYYMVEDCSGKLPIGHLSQHYQRYLVSVALYSFLNKKADKTKLLEDMKTKSQVEPFDVLAVEEESYFDYLDLSAKEDPLFLRSLLSYKRFLDPGDANRPKFKYKGLPLGDGLVATEELSASYTRYESDKASSLKNRKITTDNLINVERYADLNNALTPYARFLNDAEYYDPAQYDFSYASINPRVMHAQNPELYKAFFSYNYNDDKLKMMYSVSAPPDTNQGDVALSGRFDETDINNLQSAIADKSFFEIKTDENFISKLTANATSTMGLALPIAYNARGKKGTNLVSGKTEQQRMLQGIFKNTLATAPDPVDMYIPVSDGKNWESFYLSEASGAVDKSNIYYIAMSKAIKRLEKAMRSDSAFSHASAAENTLSRVVTRKALEYMIIKCVFGDSIIFAFDAKSDPATKKYINTLDADKTKVAFIFEANATLKRFDLVNMNLLKIALEKGLINLDNVKFVRNALDGNSGPVIGSIHSDFANDNFIPLWLDAAGDSSLTTGIANVAATKRTPQMGFALEDPTATIGSRKFLTYLAHPETNQKGLKNSFVSVPVMASYLYLKTKNIDTAGTAGTVTSDAVAPEYKSDPTKVDLKTLYFATNIKHTVLLRGDPLAKRPGDPVPPPYDPVELAYVKLDSTTLTKEYATALPSGGSSRLFKIKAYNNAGAPIFYDFLPADFSVFETKVRLAVLVNLLNAIIPQKISPSQNSSDFNGDSLFSGGASDTLRNFIDFEAGGKKGWYTINRTDYPNYLNKDLTNWKGGNLTPAMTFWKYGVHSTTFKITVDAEKHDDITRLTSVVAFDYDSVTNSPNGYDNRNANLDIMGYHQYRFSSIYLNPSSRADKTRDETVIGVGKKRYPYFSGNSVSPFNGNIAQSVQEYKNTDGYRILSHIWSKPHSITAAMDSNSMFQPIHCFPPSILNVAGTLGDASGKAGSWYYVDHPGNAPAFTTYSKSRTSGANEVRAWPSRYGPYGDISMGSTQRRIYTAGQNSWFRFTRNVTKTMKADTLECGMVFWHYYNRYQPQKSTNIRISISDEEGIELWNHTFNFKSKVSRPNMPPVSLPIELKESVKYKIKATFLTHDGLQLHIKDIFIREIE